MPAMDGIELGRRIQAVRADLPLVMLSSLGSQGVPAGAGVRFARMLTKPVKQSALYDALMEVLDRVPRPAPTAAAHPSIAAPLPQPGELPALRVLVVEDNLVNQRVAVRLLERLGYKPDLAANGLEALQAVQRQPYDLVFMDLQMPEMDGLEATRRICQAWPAAQRPRIAAMTADALEGDRERCIEAGMDDYLSKPVTLQALAAALRKTPPRTDAPPAPRPVEGPLDLVVLRQLREEIGDDATFRTLVLSYLKEAPRAIGQMWECLARHDARALGRAAHGFKSTSATVGAMSLAAHCKQLEALGAAGSLDGAELRVVEIELGFHPVREALMAQLAPRPAAP
jgi:CheY-like chemotaxis protein/HPt (histidine-containing phosphotransfer) domain-containing protein